MKNENQYFKETQEFMGSITDESITINDLHFKITYSKIDNENIEGIVIGNGLDLEKIRSLDFSKRLRLFSENELLQINSESFRITKFSFPPIVNGIQQKQYDVAEIIFESISFKHKTINNVRNSISYYLTGPTTIFNLHVYQDNGKYLKASDNNTIIIGDNSVDINIDLFQLYHHDKQNKYNVSTYTTFVTIIDLLDQENSVFIEKANAIINKILLMMSFISRKWIDWYYYDFISNNCFIRHIRKGRKCINEEIYYDKLLIEYNRSYEFITTGYQKYNDLLGHNIDLKMPLTYYLLGLEAKYIEEKFTSMFLALERLKDMYSRAYKIINYIDKPLFNNIKAKIHEIINSATNKTEADKMLCKISDLNRPSIRFIIEKMLKEYEIQWEELYPNNKEITLFTTRNALFHTNKEFTERSYKDCYRLQYILERLLLKMLGWSDFKNSPPEHTLEWLRE